MRISDWSSDVCSSDLHEGTEIGLHQFGGARQVRRDCRRVAKACQCTITDADGGLRSVQRQLIARDDIAVACELHACGADRAQTVVHRDGPRRRRENGEGIVQIGHVDRRSEEHTSELQSLMRRSYAVFCLKKKKTKT